MTNTGQAKRNRGIKKFFRLWPLLNHTTISLSRYIRLNVATMATNSDSVKIVGIRPSTAYPIKSTTSCGLTDPRDACPSVRIKTIVNTMVSSTTKVAPKLRASSRRRVDWNNMAKGARMINETAADGWQIRLNKKQGVNRWCGPTQRLPGSWYPSPASMTNPYQRKLPLYYEL